MRPADALEAPYEFVALLTAVFLLAYTAVVGVVTEERAEEVWTWVVGFLQCVRELKRVCRVRLLALELGFKG